MSIKKNKLMFFPDVVDRLDGLNGFFLQIAADLCNQRIDINKRGHD